MSATARERSPASEEAFVAALAKGGELLAANRVDEARQQLEHANTLVPKNEKALNLLGLTYFKLGQFAQAAQVYEVLASDNPVDPTLRVNLGLAYLKTNNVPLAVKEFETATDLEPTHKKAQNYLGLALAQAGEYERARQHFLLAGSDAMADKMAKAMASAPAPAAAPPSAPAPAGAPAAEDDSIEVMSDDASTSVDTAEGAEIIDAVVAADPPPAGEQSDEASSDALASDEALHAVSSDSPVPMPSPALAPAWAQSPPAEQPTWGTDNNGYSSHDSVSDAAAAHLAELQQQPVATAPDPAWATQQSEGLVAVESPVDPGQYAQAEHSDPGYATGDPAPDGAAASPWEQAATDGMVTAESEVDPNLYAAAAGDGYAADPDAYTDPNASIDAPAGDAEWQQHAHDGLTPAETSTDYASADPYASSTTVAEHEASYAQSDTGYTEASSGDGAWGAGQANEGLVAVESPVDEAAYASEPTHEGLVAVESPVDDGATAEASAPGELPAADGQPSAETDWSSVEPGAPATEVPADPAWVSQPLSEVNFSAAAAAAEPEPMAPQATAPTYEAPVVERVHVDVDVAAAAPPSAPLAPVSAADVGTGYTAMGSQKLGELGASTNWIPESASGPFHLGADGLAVSVAGEMLVRLTNLVAVVGSIDLKPEHRRVRGRQTDQPFGTGPAQLQRAKGHGVLYLEPGRSLFHAIDLDDEGAYIREERVFAFEEPISFENGRLSEGGQSVDVVHLKGLGRVLLQLEGPLKALPLPTAAPMMVPLNRLVGWFGRVTPRMVGLVGQGAMELTGEGYALLGVPADRAA